MADFYNFEKNIYDRAFAQSLEIAKFGGSHASEILEWAKQSPVFFSDSIDNDLHSKHAVEIEQIIAMSCASVAGILANSPFKFKKCTGVSGIEHPSKDPIDRTLETLNQDLKKFLKSYRRKIQGAFEHTHPEGKDVPSQDLGHMKALDIATSWLEVQFDKHLNSTNLNQDLTQGLRSPLQKRPKPFQTRKNQPKPSPF